MKKNKYQIEIRVFGEFDIKVDGESLLNNLTRLPIIIELLQYMVAHNEQELLPSVIVEEIWPDKDYLDTNKALRTYIYRLKKFLMGNNVLKIDISEYLSIYNIRGRYKLVISDECELDIWQFESKMKLLGKDMKKENLIKELEQIVEIYKGDFLQNTLYAHWTVPVRNLYLDQFCEMNLMVVKFYFEKEEYQDVIKYCDTIFEVFDLDEKVNIYFIKALMKEDRTGDALRHYTYITSKMYNELNIKPSRELVELYNLLKNPVENSTKDKEDKQIKELQNNSVQNLIVQKFPRAMKKYKLESSKQDMTVGLIRYMPKEEKNSEQLSNVIEKTKNCLDIILLKEYNFSVFGSNVIVFFIRDEKEDFIKLVADQINNYIQLNFSEKYHVDFQLSVALDIDNVDEQPYIRDYVDSTK